MPHWPTILSALRSQGLDLSDTSDVCRVGGGDISAAWRLDADLEPLFVKTGPAAAVDMFRAEADGLRDLAAANALRVPGVVGCGPDCLECEIPLLPIRAAQVGGLTDADDGCASQQVAVRSRLGHTAWHFHPL